RDIIIAYELALQEKVDVPFWILQVVADAFLALRQPEKALVLYQVVLKSQPDSFNVKMPIYDTLIDLGRFQEAGRLLESMDKVEPIQVKERGILKDNVRKEQIAANKVWLLMYQDRLMKAQKLGDKYINAAPGDSQMRLAMAHLNLWRGWKRHALEEFRILRTTDPSFVSAKIGFARALYENMHQMQAREILKSLLKQYPNNLQLSQAKHQMDVDDMAMITVSGYYGHEIPGSDEFYLSTRYDQPINDHHKFFTEIIRRKTKGDSGSGDDLTQRFYIGDIYRPNNTWKLTNALTGNYDTGQQLGGISEVELTPDDYWTHNIHYDSKTIDVPLRSRMAGVDVQDYSWSSRYRQSESFNTALNLNFKNFDDGNANWNYSWTTDTALLTYAYWKCRVGTEFDYTTFSKHDVDYYNPKKLYDLYLIPNVEHIWYKRYEKSVLDRFFVGLGQQWEENLAAENVGFLRYELEYRHSDTLSFLLGATYSLKNYSGQSMNALNTYLSTRKKF
ncbi:MAG: tetratricopeptide repeat protein, partial [Candidatus Omnitrophota bacterium]